MMKRVFFLSFLLFVFCEAFSQRDTSAVLNAVTKLRSSLVTKDTVELRKLLHPSIAFGHSSGWVQTFTEIFSDMRTGFLVYGNLESQSLEISINGQYASVREKIAAEGTRDGKSFKLNLFVLQLWVKTKKGWQLLSRQSTKLS